MSDRENVCTSVSPVGYSILANLVHVGYASAWELLQATFPRGHSWTIRLWAEEWPQDTAEWFGDLQCLLDRGLVARVLRGNEYQYRATPHGLTVLLGAFHGITQLPKEMSERSVA